MSDKAPIDGVDFDAFIRAKARADHAPEEIDAIAASLSLPDAAAWQRVDREWTERMAQNPRLASVYELFYVEHATALKDQAASQPAPLDLPPPPVAAPPPVARSADPDAPALPSFMMGGQLGAGLGARVQPPLPSTTAPVHPAYAAGAPPPPPLQHPPYPAPAATPSSAPAPHYVVAPPLSPPAPLAPAYAPPMHAPPAHVAPAPGLPPGPPAHVAPGHAAAAHGGSAYAPPAYGPPAPASAAPAPPSQAPPAPAGPILAAAPRVPGRNKLAGTAFGSSPLLGSATPFAAGPGVPPVRVEPAPVAMPKRGAHLGSTAPLMNVAKKEALPFPASREPSPPGEPQLPMPLEHYAGFLAELARYPHAVAALRARYGIRDEAAQHAVGSAFGAAFERHPGLRAQFDVLLQRMRSAPTR